MSHTGSNSGCILVVDDQPANLRAVSALLTRHGYSVATAGSGEEALQLAAETAPDLLLLDMNSAAARAATRRGSSITIRRPCSHGASSSAGGTCVVLPAPGGASSTSRGCCASDSRIRGRSSLMGKSVTPQG